MKTHHIRQMGPAPRTSGKGRGFYSQTNYPTGPVLQGRFLLSIGPSDIATGLPHGDRVVNNVMDYYDRAYGDDKQRTLRYTAPVDGGRAGMQERSKADHEVYAPGNLSQLGQDEELELVGHGGGPVDATGEMTHVTELGGMGAGDLAVYLIRNGLPRNYKGTIYLTGCSSGKGGANSFSVAFQNALAVQRHLNTPPKVVGYTGSVRLGNLDEKDQDRPFLIVDRSTPEVVRVRKETIAMLLKCTDAIPRPNGAAESAEQRAAADRHPLVRLSAQIARVNAHLKPFFYLDSIMDDRATLRVGHQNATTASLDLHASEAAIIAQCDAFLAKAEATFNLIHPAENSAPAAEAVIEARLAESNALGVQLRETEIPDTSDNSEPITHENAVQIPQPEGCCVIL
jgi:hypothetical protein